MLIPPSASTIKARHRPSPAPLESTFAKAKVRATNLLASIRRAHEKRRIGTAKYFTRLYLQSYDVRLWAVHEADRSLAKFKRSPMSSLPGIAESLNLWRPSEEEVLVRLIPKKSGALRVIQEFGIEHKARQHLLAELLRVTTHFLPNQFGCKGHGGTHALIKQAQTAIRAGYHWVTEVDIKNFYPSINLEQPDLLPLPKEVQLHTLTNSSFKTRFTYEHKLHTKEANTRTHSPYYYQYSSSSGIAEHFKGGIVEAVLSGIPQGSGASPIVAEILLAPVLAALPSDSVVLNYADNFLLLSKTQEQAVSIEQALCRALTAHRAGPLVPKIKRYRPGDMIEFLGFAFQAHAACQVEPSSTNLAKFRREFANMQQRVAKTSERGGSANFTLIRQMIDGWCSAFSLWEAVQRHRDHHLGMLKKAAIS